MNTLFRFSPSPTCIIREGALVPVKNKPTFFPRFNFPAHLDEESAAGLLGDGDVVTGVDVVARGLHVAPQVKVLLPDGQVAGQGSRLGAEGGSTVSSLPWCSSSEPLGSSAAPIACHLPPSPWPRPSRWAADCVPASPSGRRGQALVSASPARGLRVLRWNVPPRELSD